VAAGKKLATELLADFCRLDGQMTQLRQRLVGVVTASGSGSSVWRRS
jgi:hypothetical protein